MTWDAYWEQNLRRLEPRPRRWRRRRRGWRRRIMGSSSRPLVAIKITLLPRWLLSRQRVSLKRCQSGKRRILLADRHSVLGLEMVERWTERFKGIRCFAQIISKLPETSVRGTRRRWWRNKRGRSSLLL